VTVRRLAWGALVGLSLFGRSAFASEPATINLPQPNINQVLADQVVGQLRQSAILRNYRVDVSVRGGDVELTGTVADLSQKEEVLRLVQGLPGVVRVLDHIGLGSQAKSIIPVQAPSLPSNLPTPSEGGAPAKDGKDGAKGKGLPEPLPMFGGGGPGAAELNPPRMPPYAWPTYAPYNNYSRVAYPEAYPWQSWPFIGPMYPFPKVPLGWRAVKLEWDDGYWWYGQVGNKYNWWKIRYW
jgi:hypothetical protein